MKSKFNVLIEFPLNAQKTKSIKQSLYLNANKNDLTEWTKIASEVRKEKYPRSKKAKYGKLTRGFTSPELKEFFSLFKPEEYRFKFYCLWSLWWGNRQGETYKLNLKDLNIGKQTVIIHREKGENLQEFKVDDALWIELLNYLQLYEKEIKAADGFIFFSASRTQKNKTEKCWTPGWTRRKFREITARNPEFNLSYAESEAWHQKAIKRKLYQYTLHSFRYSFAYLAIDLFGDPTKVKELMGHKKIDSTMHYIENYRHSQVKEFSKDLQQYSPLKKLL
ncbi:MAG: site-specific integrase [Candidatus Diapherotrites archaeon]